MERNVNKMRWWISFFVFVLGCSLFSFYCNTKAAGKVRLNKTSLTLSVGKTTQLKVKNAPKGVKIKWSSNKKKIATVSKKGMVTAKREGPAKITANVRGKKYTCNVTVEAKKKNTGETSENKNPVNTEHTDVVPVPSNQPSNNNTKKDSTADNTSTDDGKSTEQEKQENESEVTFQSISVKYNTVVMPRVELDSAGWTTDINSIFQSQANIARQAGVELIFSDGSVLEYDQYKTSTEVSGFDGGKIGAYDAIMTISYEGKSNSTLFEKEEICNED